MMIKVNSLLVIAIFCFRLAQSQPIQLHPENQHYFQYQGKPSVLVASTEHYGAVINKAFDFETYLTTLEKIGLNHVRIFLGDYFEFPGAFCMPNNPLAPDSTHLLTPWKRSNVPGFKLGGNKFDLNSWNPEYFDRLNEFMESASDKGIVVEAVLFFSCIIFDTSPFYGSNNINGLPNFTSIEYRTLSHSKLIERQKTYVYKLVQSLNQYDNLILNICNEPWFSNQEHDGFASPPPAATNEWIKEVSNWIVDAEKQLSKKHLISVDYTNEGEVIPEEDLNNYFKHIAVFNHHYDRDAESVKLNYDRVQRVMAFNETGLMVTSSPEYRIQGWRYLMNGGGLYDHLDYTFQVGDENGNGTVLFDCGITSYNGCTDHDVKFQMGSLLKFWNSIDFVNMKPSNNCLALVYGNLQTLGFYKEDEEWVVYFIGDGLPRATLSTPPGTFKVTWYDPRTLQKLVEEEVQQEKPNLKLFGPGFTDDIVVKVTRL